MTNTKRGLKKRQPRETTKQRLKNKEIAVVGGGIFGVLAAIELAKRGYSVTIFEKDCDILLGASYMNQNRLHMGYHYPRSEETAKTSSLHQSAFAKLFQEAIVSDFEHYYCIAKKGSLTTPKEFLSFCDRVGLPYKKEFPKHITLNKNMVSLSVKVPEKLYDARILRKKLNNLIKKNRGVHLRLSTEVREVKIASDGLIVTTKIGGKTLSKKYDAVLNATYANVNRIISGTGFEQKEYQYELCEMPVVRVPWTKRTGCGVMDGPFWGILPFGFSDEYLLYDVEHSVLERSIGVTPKFKKDPSFYNTSAERQKRFRRYIKKAQQFVPAMADCTYLYSLYITRIVLPQHDHDDARPTETVRHGQGIWSIFSGKISASIPTAEKIAEEVDAYFSAMNDPS